MRGWWRRRDTLFLRLFVLMWVAIAVAHVAAWSVVVHVWAPRAAQPGAAAAGHGAPPLPPLGSLPPTPGMPGPPPRAPAPEGAATPRPLPLAALLVDYGIRALLIGVAAWWAARWVANPVRRMVGAARELSASVAHGAPVVPLDTRHGPAEMRDAAHVFNEMAARLAEEFRSRGLLIAAISHDLRTPLTRIRMRLESLQPAAQAERCIGDLREMNELIDGAIYVFRGENTAAEPAQPTDIYALVQSLADDLVEQGHAVTLQGQRAVATVRPAALRRAVSNLIGNALRHGGSAEVTVLTLDGIRILVDDHGPGIPADKIDAVFRPFMRLDPSRSRETGGAGLGLHIARDLLRQQGATLSLGNRAEGGLRAEIRLGERAASGG